MGDSLLGAFPGFRAELRGPETLLAGGGTAMRSSRSMKEACEHQP
jgi:hypothetical protein